MTRWSAEQFDEYERKRVAQIGKPITAGGAIREDARGMVSPSVTPATLPWPPTGNTAVRHAKGGHYLRPEVVTYRATVAAILARAKPVSGAYELHVELSPPDRRARDIDNALKSLLDACVKAGWLPSDAMSHMRRLTVTVADSYLGYASVRAIEL